MRLWMEYGSFRCGSIPRSKLCFAFAYTMSYIIWSYFLIEYNNNPKLFVFTFYS